MKLKRTISGFLASAMLASSAAFVSATDADMNFKDVKSDDWFYDDVKSAFEAGLMEGVASDIFEPQNSITRAQVVAVVARMYGAEESGAIDGKGKTCTFTDIRPDDWYADYVGWAQESNVTDGYPDGTFGPNKSVSREELAAFLSHYFSVLGVGVKESSPLIDEFADKNKISSWAAEDVEAIRKIGLIEGDENGNFNPTKSTTRAEGAAVFSRTYNVSETDDIEDVFEKVKSLVCEEHGTIHYARNDINNNLERLEGFIEDSLHINKNKYKVNLTPRMQSLYDDFANNIFRDSYSTVGIPMNVSVSDKITGETTEKLKTMVSFYLDYALASAAILGACPEKIGDSIMEDTWNGLDKLYVYNDDGKIMVPYTACASKQAFSDYFTHTLLGLYDHYLIGSRNDVHELQISDEDFAKIAEMLNAGGGDLSVSANLRNKTLKQSSDIKTLDLKIMDQAACKKFLEDLNAQMHSELISIKALMAKCEELGIPTDYETAAVSVLERFAEQYMPDYMSHNDFERLTYLEQSIGELCDIAKTNLNAYLNEEKEPLNVPRYVTSDMEIDGYTLIADTIDSYGKAERRPVYFYGYGDGYQSTIDEIPNYQSLGANTYHYMELYIDDVIRRPVTGDEEGISADGKYVVDTALLEPDLKMLAEAEKSNIAVTLLIIRGVDNEETSAYLFDAYPELRTDGEADSDGGALNMNPDCEKGREIIEAYLRAVVPLIKEYKSVNNIVLSNEPAYKPSSYASFYNDEWVEFLKDKYGDIESLNEAYDETYSSFEDVPLAYREDFYKRDLLSYDNQLFAREVHAGWHKWMAGIIKEMAPDIPISTKLKSVESDRGLQQRNVTPEQWSEFQDLGGCDDIYEDTLYYDHIAGCQETPVVDSEIHILTDEHNNQDRMLTPSRDDFMERVVWRGFMHHMGIGNLWSWCYFPHAGGSDQSGYGKFNWRPVMMYNIGKTTMDLNRLSYEVNAIVEKEADVALLYSYPSRQYTAGRGTETIQNAYEACLYNGEKVRIVSEEQIEKINKCKILILPECENVSDKTLEEIYKFASGGGKVIMIGRNCLTKDEFNKTRESDLVAKLKELSTVIDAQCSFDSYLSIFEEYFKENEVQNVWLVDAKTGETVRGETEWLSAEYEGSTLVTAYAMGIKEPMEVKLVIDGKTVTSSKELRSGEEYGETFTLYPDAPILLKVGGNVAEKREIKKVEELKFDDFSYSILENGKAKITGYTGDKNSVVVPAAINGVAVERIGAYAFSKNGSITEVVVSDGISRVEKGAFAECAALKKVVLSDSVKHIGECAFYYCTALETAELGQIDSVGKRAFMKCVSLKSISLPETVAGIGEFAFTDCKALESVRVPNGVSAIEPYAFMRCEALKSFDFPDSLTSLGHMAFRGCRSLSGDIVIPYGILDVGYFTFSECENIKTVTLPNSVKVIEPMAFYACYSLTEVNLPNSLLSIENEVFVGCNNIERLEIPYGVRSIGRWAFQGKSVVVPSSVVHMTDPFLGPDRNNPIIVYCEAGSHAEFMCKMFEGSYMNFKAEIVELEKGHVHTPGNEAECESHQTCVDCGAVITGSYGHMYNLKADYENGTFSYECRVCGDKLAAK